MWHSYLQILFFSAILENLHRDAIGQLVAGSATGVVYFGDAQTATGLLDAAINVPNSGNLQWLMSETVGTDTSVVKGRYCMSSCNVIGIPIYILYKIIVQNINLVVMN